MKSSWKRTFVLVILLILIVLSIFGGDRQIAAKHEEELVQNLQLMTKQMGKTIETELKAEQTRLLSMAAEVSTAVGGGTSVEQILEILASMNEISSFKRAGIVNVDGSAVTTDGYYKELGFRDFFQRSLNGEFVVTGTLMDTIGQTEPINVFSAPVYNENQEVTGVIFASYRNEEFRKLFDLSDYQGSASNCIVDEQSKVISYTSNLPFNPDEQSLWEFLESLGEEAQQIMDNYYKDPRQYDPAKYRVAGGDGNDYYIYFEPIDMGQIDEQWYVVSMITSDTLKKQVVDSMKIVTIMLIEIMVLVFLAFFMFIVDTNRVAIKQRRELEQVAYVDSLTGGDNYASFRNKVTRNDRIGFVVSMDIHSFKMINSICGNEKGDEVICYIYKWIKEAVSPEDLVAHVEADRFVMFFPRLEKESVLKKLTAINAAIISGTREADLPQLSAYYGISWFERGDSIEKTFSDANFARDSIHSKKDVFYAFFDKFATQKILEDKKIEDSFEKAIATHEFEVWYQPKYMPDTRAIVGAEALIRWRRSDGQLVSPGRFIPIYEGNGMIRTLDEYVFCEVCTRQKKWLDEGYELFPISVNLSRASLYSPNVVERYKDITENIGIDPKYVPIEITESAAVDDRSIQNLTDEFYRNGFPLHMDDFGSGYSSLASLNRLHFDTLKLDKSLIDYIGNFGGDQLIKHTIALAKDLGMHVTAEGVEEEKQVIFLQELKCDSIQGFYYSRPVPLDEFEALAERK